METVMEFCAFCGEEFKKTNHNQRYCCEECCKTAENQRRRQRDRQRRRIAQKSAKVGANPLSIEDMVEIALKLSKKYGRVVSYGEVQRLLITGRLKLKDGVMA